MTDDGLCRRAVATARWILETPSASDLSVRDLALLAGMTEGAVRNALAAAGVKAKGSRTYVDVAFARSWLAGRRGFIPTTCWAYGPDAAHRDLRTARGVASLGAALARRAEQKGLSATALAAALDLDPALVAGRAVELVLRQAS